MSRELLRKLPRVDDLLQRPAITDLVDRLPRELVVGSIRDVLDRRRKTLLAGSGGPGIVTVEAIEKAITDELAERLTPRLSSLINATGVVLHTNLGRAPLGHEILAEAAVVAAGYSNLEYDLEARRRGSRYVHSAELLRRLTGAEDSLVVNNNAAAVLLALGGLADGRDVLVSRGELIEIGGSFRIPDICRASGARLVEVGTTNRTHLRDFEAAIGSDTAMLLKVHRSNFEIVGFTAEVSGADLAALARDRGVLAVEDLGSGCMIDLRPYGLDTVTVADQVGAGLDLVTFSGDKLLGGPQAGIIVGRADLVARLRKHPLTRALRVDKLTLATLERSLLAYVDGTWRERLPALAMLTATEEELDDRAGRLRQRLVGRLGDAAEVTTERSTGRVGGGALPMASLAGKAVRVRLVEASAVAVDEALRGGDTPIICRIDEDALVFDVRCVLDEQLALVSERLGALIAP